MNAIVLLRENYIALHNYKKFAMKQYLLIQNFKVRI